MELIAGGVAVEFGEVLADGHFRRRPGCRAVLATLMPMPETALQGNRVDASLDGMSITGTVKDGVIVLPPGLHLPEGAEVQLTVPDDVVPAKVRFVKENGYTVGVSDQPVTLEAIKAALSEFP